MNLFDTHPPFQIDGNFGGTAGIAEMLLQSHGDTILILPALPASWKDGSISGLKARGNYDMDIYWKDGKLTKLVIKANNNAVCKIKYRSHVSEFLSENGKRYTLGPDLKKL
jgi:alpha-L-fucosidase 2